MVGGNIVIRAFQSGDLDTVMQIWLDTNIQAHDFISEKHWGDHLETVKSSLPKAEVYVYEERNTNQIEGFIGLVGDYIAGIFVRDGAQSKGIGKQLLDYVKKFKSNLTLNVYQKNVRAMRFYQREAFVLKSESTDESTKEKEFVMVWERYSILAEKAGKGKGAENDKSDKRPCNLCVQQRG